MITNFSKITSQIASHIISSRWRLGLILIGSVFAHIAAILFLYVSPRESSESTRENARFELIQVHISRLNSTIFSTAPLPQPESEPPVPDTSDTPKTSSSRHAEVFPSDHSPASASAALPESIHPSLPETTPFLTHTDDVDFSALSSPPKTHSNVDSSELGSEPSPNISDSYAELIQSSVSRHKYYPLLSQRRRDEGVVRLTLLIRSDGQVDTLRIAQKSSFDALNQAALKAVMDAAPFPPVPSEVEAPFFIQLNLLFQLTPDTPLSTAR